MKYFLDTEFIEHATGIELLSIGIICEDGRTFYAENTAVDIRLANDWVKENVLSKLSTQNPHNKEFYIRSPDFCIDTEDYYGVHGCHPCKKWHVYGNYEDIKNSILQFICSDKSPTFYAYYADYDWVVFCKIFGRMIDLPEHFPMYCRDLKQTLDEKVEKMNYIDVNKITGENRIYFISPTFNENLDRIKRVETYPKQENEHNALEDAKWNFELYKFIKKL